MDDACDAEEMGQGSAISLRQLRAEARHLAADIERASGQSGGGFCCFSGARKDTCGSCWPTAKAVEGTFCASQGTCSGCGGTWCMAQCVFAGSDPSNVCGTAYESAIAHTADFCAKSETSCKGCKGTWCAVSAQMTLQSPSNDSSSELQSAEEILPPAGKDIESQSSAPENTRDFCCYSGATKDTCGSCWPTAKAEEGDFCASHGTCSGCGGTWCTMHCVFAGSDASNVCGTAYDTASASATDFCGKSESSCKGCKGTWCAVTTLPIRSVSELRPLGTQ